MASASILFAAKPSPPQENGKGFSEFSGNQRNSSANSVQFRRKINSKDFMSTVIAFHTTSSMKSKQLTKRTITSGSAVKQSSTSNVATDKKEEEIKQAPPNPKAPSKAPAKALPQMMEEDIIPSLRAILETPENELSHLELFFQDNKLEGSFIKKGNPYSFWAFFPDGVLTGPKGFSLSSYGSGPSTVEPFLVDEKKITARHVIFWVEKRLAAQGIIPVWKD